MKKALTNLLINERKKIWEVVLPQSKKIKHKIMKKTIFILSMISLLIFPSCDDFIDITPKGKVIPTTIQHFKEMMDNPGEFSISIGNMYDFTDEIRIYDDEINRIFFRPFAVENGYLFKDSYFLNTTDDDTDWSSSYSAIYICNVVLDKIDEAEGDDEELRKIVKAEALAQRAYIYFMLVNEYANHYDPATADTDLGVPLLTKADINIEPSRATVAEVYEFVERDLLEAEEDAPTTVDFNYHPTKAGIQGVLAKMYLFMGNWEKAKEYANKALNTNSFLYDYNMFDFMPGMPKMFGLMGYPTQGYDHQEAIWFKRSNNSMAYLIATYMTDEHKALYDEGDRRLYFRQIDMFYFGPNLHGDCIYIPGNIYKSGIFTPELYLIRAEANARLNKIPAAIDDLNTLREKRFTTGTFIPYDDTDMTSLGALDLVIKERRVELFLTGQRLFDLKRLNKDPHFAKTITRVFDGVTYTIEPDDPNYVLPIPLMVTTLNPNIEQNERAGRN